MFVVTYVNTFSMRTIGLLNVVGKESVKIEFLITIKIIHKKASDQSIVFSPASGHTQISVWYYITFMEICHNICLPSFFVFNNELTEEAQRGCKGKSHYNHIRNVWHYNPSTWPSCGCSAQSHVLVRIGCYHVGSIIAVLTLFNEARNRQL